MTLAYLQLTLNAIVFVIMCILCYLTFRKPRPPKS